LTHRSPKLLFEALAGQLYLVITLARLVSLAVICPNPGDN
jgi:hypothetical protein